MPLELLTQIFVKDSTSIDFEYVKIGSDEIQAIFKNLKINAKVKIMIQDKNTFEIEFLDTILHRL